MTDTRMALPTVQRPTPTTTPVERHQPVQTVTVHPVHTEAETHRGSEFTYDTADGQLTGALFFALIAGLFAVVAVFTPVDLVRLLACGGAGLFCVVAGRVLTRGGGGRQ